MGAKPKRLVGQANAVQIPPGRSAAGSGVRIAVAAALAGAALPHAPPSFADAPSQPPVSGGLEEIVVTSRKISENLQDVPLSIDVFTAKDMKNLGIASMDDYLQKTPSISYVSTGPGTQLFVMRGVSDGSNPNYANTASTGFFVDDLSMNYGGAQPDLHLYDIERIEVLNGPQGTTYGAAAMSGAIRYITNKPDSHAFSAGIDTDIGHIQSAATNQTYEAFVNVPLIDGILGFRASAFSVSNGGFINNQLTTRTWVNGAVSNNAPWAGHDYNHENVRGGRLALKADFNESWSVLFTYGFQKQHTNGAWDEDPTLPKLTVERFGPEQNLFETNMADLHIEGDVGIGDLVFASAFWNQERRQWNEYSQYEQNYNAGARNTPPDRLPRHAGRLYLPQRPVLWRWCFHGLQPGDAVLLVPGQSQALVERAAALIQGGRTPSLARRRVLAGDQRSQFRRKLLHAGAAIQGCRVPKLSQLLRAYPAIAAPRYLVRLHRNQSRPRDQRIRQHQFRRDRQAECGSGGRVLPLLFELRHPLAGLRLSAQPPERL